MKSSSNNQRALSDQLADMKIELHSMRSELSDLRAKLEPHHHPSQAAPK
jgi:hypothetical protein